MKNLKKSYDVFCLGNLALDIIIKTVDKFPVTGYSVNFNEYFSNNRINEQRHNKTSNLFYVVCSRAKNNLAVVCVSTLSNEAKTRVKEWFLEKNYIEIDS